MIPQASLPVKRKVYIPVVAKRGITDAVIADCEEQGMTIAAGREMGIY